MTSALLNPPLEEAVPGIGFAPPQPGLRLQAAERLAAHRNRRSRAAAQPEAPQPTIAQNSRTARIAAAVVERYAHSPSYRAVLAAEAERAIREAAATAEVAARNAEAIEIAQRQLIEDLKLWDETAADAATAPQPLTKPRLTKAGQAATPVPGSADASADRPFGGLTVRLFDTSASLQRTQQLKQTANTKPASTDSAETLALDEEIAFRHAPVFEEDPGPAVGLPANLLEFPRQLVAPRKARARHAEGPLREDATDPNQLRIFEVEADSIGITPTLAIASPEWSSIWLDAIDPAVAAAIASDDRATAVQAPTAFEASGRIASEDVADAPTPRPEPASLPDRLMAATVDACLAAAGSLAFIAAFALVAGRGVLPHLSAGLAVAAGLAVLTASSLLYQVLFFSLSTATPGMRYARIALCTLGDDNPTRSAMRRRALIALPLSLGFFSACFDADGLTWHDRLTRTYQRSY